jgi:hypothetical protein
MSRIRTEADLSVLLDQYRAMRAQKPLPCKQMAELERLIGDQAPMAQHGTPFRHWWSETCGCQHYDLNCRSILLSLGTAGEPLWDRMAQGMPNGTLMGLAREARRRAGNKYDRHSLLASIEECLRIHDRRPPEPATPQGAAPAAPSALAEALSEESELGDDPRGLWARVRSLIMAYGVDRLQGMLDHERHELLTALERDVQGVFQHHQHKWSRVGRNVREALRVTRPQFRNALRVLHMDPPRRGEELDLQAARRSQRQLLRLYHPDARSGDVSMNAQYQAVIEAFDLVERWANENATADIPPAVAEDSKPALRIVRGGRK